MCTFILLCQVVGHLPVLVAVQHAVGDVQVVGCHLVDALGDADVRGEGAAPVWPPAQVFAVGWEWIRGSSCSPGRENTCTTWVGASNGGLVAKRHAHKWIKTLACTIKLISTYFPESLQPGGGVEGTLEELCNETIDKVKSHQNSNVYNLRNYE